MQSVTESKTPQSVLAVLEDYRRNVERELEGESVDLILYGSYARGDYHDGSDVDVMVLPDITEDEVSYVASRIFDLTYDFNLAHGTEIMPTVQSSRVFEYWKDAYMFYKNVDSEGIKIA